MRPDSRSVSFTFHREVFSDKNSPELLRNTKHLRQRLQDRFDKEQSNDAHKERYARRKGPIERSWSNLSFRSMTVDSRRALRNGAERLSRTISSMKTTFGTITQKFRNSTRRCQRLEEHSPGNSTFKYQTPQTRSRQLLGRTPTKLYSPFGIESPRTAWDKENDATPHHNSTNISSGRVKCQPFRLTKTRGFSLLR
ncbi:uncharacterized protein [Prorops nasuta]|uniref:uncharacterized protein n=1 Tax=Prorops nasuta TaxID=863751 RepID=UPI0034CF41F3